MAKKISQTTPAGSLGDSDLYAIVQSGQNKTATGKQVGQRYSDFVIQSGGAWDGSNKTLVASSNTSLSFSAGPNRTGWLFFIQDGTGGRTLDIAGNSIPVSSAANSVTAITYVYDAASTKFRFFAASSLFAISGSPTAPDTTAPTVSSRATGSTTTIIISLSENVTSTTAGWSFKKNGSNLAITSVSGSGTSILTFTVATMANGDTITCSYNSGTGDCKDGANNPLASFTDQSVTNSIGSLTSLNAPTGVTLGTATATTQPLTWTDTNSSPNDSGYKVYKNATNNFGTATLCTTTAANATSYTVTGLTPSTPYYYWVVAAGDGTTTSDSSPSTVVSGSTAADNGTPATLLRANSAITYNGVLWSGLPSGPWADYSSLSSAGTPSASAYFEVAFTKGVKWNMSADPSYLGWTADWYIDGVLQGTVTPTAGSDILEVHPNTTSGKVLKVILTICPGGKYMLVKDNDLTVWS